MKNKILSWIALVVFLFGVALPIQQRPHQVVALESFAPTPYTTVTAGIGGRYAYSAPAYDSLFILNRPLNNAQDIFIGPDEKVYISDTGNKRVMVYEPATTNTTYITYSGFVDPQGVFVNSTHVYVADPQAEAVFMLTLDGTHVKTFGRPVEVIFGEEEFYQPLKVVVDARGNLFIASQGNANGLVQLNSLGEFIRYFGMNSVSVDIGLLIRRAFMAEAQRDLLAPLRPRTTSNLAIDSRNLIYTVIYGETGTSMKKLNVEGDDIFTGDALYYQDDYVDITVDQKGYVYVLSDGTRGFTISVHDRAGNLLFRFGHNQVGSSVMGIMEKPSGIAVDGNGNIWVLDAIGNNVQVFVKTQFANTVIGAIDAYENGFYDDSMDLYNEVIMQNNTFTAAYKGRGLLYQRLYEYELALEDFRIADYKVGYSEVYWEYRDELISRYFLWFVGAIAAWIISRWVYRKYSEQWSLVTKVKSVWSRWKATRLYRELQFIPQVLKDPADVVYEIKYRQTLRWSTSLGLFVVFVLLNIISDNFIRGNLFKPAEVDIVLSFEILKYGLLFLILTLSNQLMSSLQNGEGFYRDVFMVSIISMAPFFIFKIPLDILSNVLTYNEQFVFDLGNFIILGWSLFNVLYTIKEVHNYKIGELIVNLALTLFTALILVLLYLVLSVLFGQVVQFIVGIGSEVFS